MARTEAPWGLRSANGNKTAFDLFPEPTCAVSAARGISMKDVDVWAAGSDWWFDGSHSLRASHDETASGIRSNKDHDMSDGWLSRGFVSVLPEKEIASFESVFQPGGIYLSRGGARSVPDTLLLAQEIILIRGRAPDLFASGFFVEIAGCVGAIHYQFLGRSGRFPLAGVTDFVTGNSAGFGEEFSTESAFVVRGYGGWCRRGGCRVGLLGLGGGSSGYYLRGRGGDFQFLAGVDQIARQAIGVLDLADSDAVFLGDAPESFAGGDRVGLRQG